MKHEIRERLLSERNGHNPGERLRKSREIMEILFSLPEFRNSRSILFYWPVKGEVNTIDMIDRALKEGKDVLLPVTDTKSRTIRACRIKSILTDLREGPFGIREPTGEIVGPEKIDLVIVPGIAFDRKGNRIGYGHGYYDKFLRNGIRTIALAFSFQVLDKLPSKEHDIKVGMVVTEDGPL